MSDRSSPEMCMNIRYRVVADMFTGYQVQTWCFGLWLQVGPNTHSSLEEAQVFIAQLKAAQSHWHVVVCEED